MALHLAGRILARFLSKRRPVGEHAATSRSEAIAHALRMGDVLLVEGNSRISIAIKYLTQSTWSHAALFVGDVLGPAPAGREPLTLVEADINEGVRAVGLSKYVHVHTRICRPVGLSDAERRQVVDFVVARIGHKYDLRNLFDLARYLIQQPPVPEQWRRRLIAFGSGDPTRAICSSLIAQAFDSIGYPILPDITEEKVPGLANSETYREILHIRHHSLYTPRDFDISPYFAIVKPTIAEGFDYHELQWAPEQDEGAVRG